ncbi:hypothetical protein BD780_001308 [Clostridium tetanomorphum]|uniref:Uncharacterized protein n=1 Tax=Clostridium tetanomorphum TaxID=1553 RepID=A0A923E7A9_CLOTT|nr:hypothetical protein [Clostridium tetanomorphum]KAJ53577.1 hypothetical protein CTM_01809 [Clostridium tetanomorphum DSM 665]MBC2397785.1 hypothetical protein [Clostridium tetanomorphum]MBP1864614.1 hypothetical protein [Clostridium tetanomorphum]NRS84083.1 hypothetical protein [Clostridium tetanomorphum]NRZ97297.1 hypothetical protein [Clostridium tetanomorphum]
MNNSILKYVLYSLSIWAVNEVRDKANLSGNNKKNLKSNIPSFRGILEVKHYLPGRIRLYIPLLKNNKEVEDVLFTQLTRIDSIQSIEISLVTGSILIHYDESKIKPILLMGVIIKLLGFEQEINKEPESLVKKEIMNLKDSVNLAVYEKTKGIFDIKAIMVLALLVSGINKCIKAPNMSPGGITYLWWAYSYIK